MTSHSLFPTCRCTRVEKKIFEYPITFWGFESASQPAGSQGPNNLFILLPWPWRIWGVQMLTINSAWRTKTDHTMSGDLKSESYTFHISVRLYQSKRNKCTHLLKFFIWNIQLSLNSLFHSRKWFILQKESLTNHYPHYNKFYLPTKIFLKRGKQKMIYNEITFTCLIFNKNGTPKVEKTSWKEKKGMI